MKKVYNADGTLKDSGQLATFLAFFAKRQFIMVGLYKFTLVDGTILYYTSGDVDVSYGGHTYSAGGTTGPYFDRKDNRAKAHWKVGVEVDSLIFDVIPGTSQVEGTDFLSACREGFFDGAELNYSRAYWPMAAFSTPISPSGVVDAVFNGRVAELDPSRSLVTFTINSFTELFNQNMPRNLFQAGCRWTLFDAGCTLDKETFGVNSTATSGSTASSINNTALSQATDYFSLGSIKFTSGVNSGLSRGIKKYTHGGTNTITLIEPFPNAPSAADTFRIYPGCDKLQATCNTKFSNLPNFGGTPYIPENSTAV